MAKTSSKNKDLYYPESLERILTSTCIYYKTMIGYESD